MNELVLYKLIFNNIAPPSKIEIKSLIDAVIKVQRAFRRF